MMRFPIQELLNEEECYRYLRDTLHPDGLTCPNGHDLPEDQAPHDRKRAPIVKYRCRECGAVYNIFTGTVWSGTQYDACIIVLLMRGFAKGTPTQVLSDELDIDYGTALKWRHRLQEQANVPSEEQTLPDKEVEADEMYQNAGEKGEKHDDEDDPPRSRSNPRRGRGTYETDRPVVTGTVGRESGLLHLAVTTDTSNDTVVPLFDQQIPDDATLYSDEALHFVHVAEPLDEHHQVTHNQDEYARDPDSDGFHEIHSNTIEGIWVGLRNFFRRFRGVHKDYLPDYVPMFEWAYNLDKVSGDFLQLLMKPDFTLLPT